MQHSVNGKLVGKGRAVIKQHRSKSDKVMLFIRTTGQGKDIGTSELLDRMRAIDADGDVVAAADIDAGEVAHADADADEDGLTASDDAAFVAVDADANAAAADADATAPAVAASAASVFSLSSGMSAIIVY